MKFKMAMAPLMILTLAACVNPKSEWKRVVADARHRVKGDLIWEKDKCDRKRIQSILNNLLADGMTRPDAVQIALLNNRALQASFENVGIAKANLIQASLPTNPDFSFAYRFSLDHGADVIESALLAWISDIWIVPTRRKVAKSATEATVHQVEMAVVDTATRATVLFDDLLFHFADVAFHREIAQTHFDTAERMKVRYHSGLVNAKEVYDAEAGAAEQQIELARAERDLAAARTAFNAFLNLNPSQTTYTLTDTLHEIPEIDWDVRKAFAFAMTHRLDVAVAYNRLRQADRAINLERARIFDRVQLGAEFEGKSPGDDELGPALDMEIPVFDWNQGNIARRKYQKRQLFREFEQLANDVLEEIVELLAEIEFRKEQIYLLEQTILDKRRQALWYSERYGNLMRLDWMNYLDSLDALQHTRREHIQALRQLRVADARLQRALLGGGRPGGLFDNNLLNEPERGEEAFRMVE